MSEYRCVCFRAIDKPLDPKQLAFAQQQSSHSELSKWAMSVEYHYGSFRGNVDGLLRGGFDVYLAYANYGDREVRIRLPGGLAFSPSTVEPYLSIESMTWKQDAKGNGGMLSVAPFHESNSVDEVWDFDTYLESLEKIREQLTKGDLRALYLLWLCAAYDDNEDPAEINEPPVPHGLDQMPACSIDLLPFFGLDPLACEAAADGVPELTEVNDGVDPIETWVNAISDQRSKALLRRLLNDEPETVKAELLAEVRATGAIVDWPMSLRERTLEKLFSLTDKLRKKENEQQTKEAEAKARRVAAKADKERRARMEKMKVAPTIWLLQAEKTAAAGGTHNYKAAAEILAELRDAIGGEKGKQLACKCAVKIAKAHPTLNMLKSSLRKQGLLH